MLGAAVLSWPSLTVHSMPPAPPGCAEKTRSSIYVRRNPWVCSFLSCRTGAGRLPFAIAESEEMPIFIVVGGTGIEPVTPAV